MVTTALTGKSQRDTELRSLAYNGNRKKFQNSFITFRFIKHLPQSPNTLSNSKELELHKNKIDKSFELISQSGFLIILHLQKPCNMLTYTYHFG